MQKKLTLLISLALAPCCHAPHADNSALNMIGGKQGGKLSTVFILGTCSAVKIGTYSFLSAAHCFFDNDKGSLQDYYVKGATIRMTNADSIDVNQASTVTIVSIHAHPSWTDACKGGCAGQLYAPERTTNVPADIALINIQEKTPFGQAALATASVPDHQSVYMNGYGCKYGINARDNSTRQKQNAKLTTLDAESLNFTIEEPITDRNAVHDAYILTPGTYYGGTSICYGDSGGPVFDTGGRVVGVNVFYSFDKMKKDDPGVSRVNWHARIDNSTNNKVADWIKNTMQETTAEVPRMSGDGTGGAGDSPSDNELCEQQRTDLLATEKISEDDYKTYHFLNQIPLFNENQSDIVGWVACSAGVGQLRKKLAAAHN